MSWHQVGQAAQQIVGPVAIVIAVATYVLTSRAAVRERRIAFQLGVLKEMADGIETAYADLQSDVLVRLRLLRYEEFPLATAMGFGAYVAPPSAVAMHRRAVAWRAQHGLSIYEAEVGDGRRVRDVLRAEVDAAIERRLTPRPSRWRRLRNRVRHPRKAPPN